MTSIGSLLDGNDRDVRPQDDLFGHVNGSWYDTVQIPADLPGFGAFVQLRLNAEQQVGDLLREAVAEVESGAAENGSTTQQIGDMFASFLDETTVEELGISPIAPDLAAIEALSTTAELAALLGRKEREGAVDGVFAVYVNTDDMSSDRYVVNVAQGGIGLPDEAYYREDQFAEIRTAYVAHVTRMLSLCGVADASSAAEQVMALETRLASGHWDNVACRDVIKTYNKVARSSLAELSPAFDFDTWAEGIGAPQSALAEVVVRQPSYLETVSSALVDVPLEAWKHWLTWQVVHAAAPFLTKAIVEESFDFYSRTLLGTEVQRDSESSSAGRTSGEASTGRRWSSSSWQSIRMPRTICAQTSCGTSTSSTRRSKPSPVTACGWTLTSGSASGEPSAPQTSDLTTRGALTGLVGAAPYPMSGLRAETR